MVIIYNSPAYITYYHQSSYTYIIAVVLLCAGTSFFCEATGKLFTIACHNWPMLNSARHIFSSDFTSSSEGSVLLLSVLHILDQQTKRSYLI